MESNFLFLVIPGRALLARARNPYSRWWLWIPGSTLTRRPGMTADFGQARTGSLFRRLTMAPRQSQQRVVLNRLDRRKIAVRDIFRTRRCADVIRDRVQREIEDLARIGLVVARRAVLPIPCTPHHPAHST